MSDKKMDDLLSLKLFGIPIYQKERTDNFVIKKYLCGMFKIKKKATCKRYYFFGIKFLETQLTTGFTGLLAKIDTDLLTKMETKLIMETRSAVAVVERHSKIFPKFKNIHKGKDIVIVGTGPTLNDYEPIENAIHIGLNKAFEFEKIKFDYLFAADYVATKSYLSNMKHYDCIKFYGEFFLTHKAGIPEFVREEASAYHFYLNTINMLPHKDIALSPLMKHNSIAFAALNFAFYTYPKKIYLVGCDANRNGYFTQNDHPAAPMNVRTVLLGYKRIKEFASIYYPDIEIISINPVGLTGLFTDIYTKEIRYEK